MRKKIAIIEDDPSIAKMYKFKLARAGFDIDVAHTGPAGLQLIQTKRPHLVLLDLRLPHMNGDEILHYMRKHEWGKAIKVLIMANVSQAHAPKHLHNLEFDHYLIKAHHTPSEILQIIQELLGKSPSYSNI